MKIGILTFHFAINYGAVIQSWALQKYLQKLGHDAFIINYDPRHYRYARWLHALKKGMKFCAREIRFRVFRKKYLKETKLFSYNEQICNLGFDAYIVGSDQVWNVDFFNFNRRYFLDFVGNEERKIAYAASVGEGRWDVHSEELVKLIK